MQVGWPALYSQFGAGFKHIRQFRAEFKEALELALAAYPDANVSMGQLGGVLRPSRPAIAKAG